jgi:hypothetical protein
VRKGERYGKNQRDGGEMHSYLNSERERGREGERERGREGEREILQLN